MKNIGLIQASYGKFPIGSILYTRSAENPSVYFGGTWERIKDVFLYGADEPNLYGGQLNHTHTISNIALTINQLPSHQHQFPFVGNSVADGTSNTQFNFLYGKGQTASVMGQKTEMYHENGSKDAEGNEYAYMTNYVGSSGTHNHTLTSASNLPPYLAIYAWKRTA